MFWKEPNRTRTDMPKYVELEPNRTHKREEPEPSTVPKPCGLGSCWFSKFVLLCLHLAYVIDHLFTSELSTEEREVFFLTHIIPDYSRSFRVSIYISQK